MDRKRIFAIIKKDVSSIAQNAQMWLPMVVVPLVFIIIIPLVITLVGRNVNFSDINQSAQVEQYLLNIPLPELKNELAQFPELMQKGVYIFSNYIFAPMFLIVPVMVSAIISANSFAGEKEKKTLESLLYTPVSEKELFFSKTAAAFLPAIAIAAAGFVLYGAVLNIFGYPLFNRLFFPSWNWLPFMVLLVPAVAMLAIGATVIVSAKVKGFAEAQQISALIVLPILLLVFSQIMGLFFLSPLVCTIAGLIILAADYLLIAKAARSFNREKLLKSYA